MRIAIFSDIHGNRHALSAVLANIDQEAPDRVYCLGDLVGYGAYPNEVIERIRDRGIPTIMGNYDDGVGFDKDECGCAYKEPEMKRLGDLSLMWAREAVTPENKEFLRSLVPKIRFKVGGKEILLVHGSPRKINEYVYEDRLPASLEHIAKSAEADALVFGHTHLPYTKEVAGVLLVNDGSVGKPKDSDARAGYVILDVGSEVKVEFRRVPYDVAAAAAAVRESGLPAHFAYLLENARG
ncbi:MAG TPA: metallophosphoesterase family protein [Chloroflexota bacterium]|nr:metallophosphoesterase family protein [Chloroflexota bacterium]